MTLRPEIVTVFGGSGFIGRYVVRELCKRGFNVRVAVRNPHAAQELKVSGEPGQIQLMQANVRNPASIERAVEGAWGVVNLVGILFEQGRQKFASTQARGAGQIAESAKTAGVQALTHISAIGADKNSAAKYARTKALGEEAVRKAFPESVILRPSIVFGAEDEFFNKFAEMARFAPALPLIGGGKTKFQPVYVGDVADAVAESLERVAARGRVFELGGPSVYTFKELMRFLLDTIHRPRVLAPIPFSVAGLMGRTGELSGALPFVEPFLTADQVRLLRRNNVVSDAPETGKFEDLGLTQLETIESIVPTYLYQYRIGGQFHEADA